MNNQKYSQLELFSQDKTVISPARSNSFINYIRSYEKALITAIVFVIAAIASFSIGVERGKKITALKAYESMDTAMLKLKQPKSLVQATVNRQNYTTSQALKTIPVKTAATMAEMVSVVETKDNAQVKTQKYTIQVASYQNRAGAQKEANILKKKGLQAVIISKGKFNVVCLGKFSDKHTASNMLTKLRKSYRDCSIRRL